MTAARRRPHPARSDGVVLVVVLVLMAAGMALSSAVARSAAAELAMVEQGLSRLRALEAAEAGLASVLRAREWSAAGPSNVSGSLVGGGDWEAEVRLLAARLDPSGGPVEWLFEIESHGRAGMARTTLARSFTVRGVLPGEPRLGWWRQLEPPP